MSVAWMKRHITPLRGIQVHAQHTDYSWIFFELLFFVFSLSSSSFKQCQKTLFNTCKPLSSWNGFRFHVIIKNWRFNEVVRFVKFLEPHVVWPVWYHCPDCNRDLKRSKHSLPPSHILKSVNEFPEFPQQVSWICQGQWLAWNVPTIMQHHVAMIEMKSFQHLCMFQKGLQFSFLCPCASCPKACKIALGEILSTKIQVECGWLSENKTISVTWRGDEGDVWSQLHYSITRGVLLQEVSVSYCHHCLDCWSLTDKHWWSEFTSWGICLSGVFFLNSLCLARVGRNHWVKGF